MTRFKVARLFCSICAALSMSNALSLSAQVSATQDAAPTLTRFAVGPIMQLRKELDNWPKITAPQTPATARANKIISLMNQSIRQPLRDCDQFYRKSLALPESVPAKADWVRSITVTMRGPRFIAITATETAFCGGAYPLNDHAAVVFDMTTGERNNWKKFLKTVTDPWPTSWKSEDGATSSEIVMPALTELAVRRADPACKEALKDSDTFQVWPDAKRGQLMIQATGQPHVTQGCEQAIGLSMADARALGFGAEILDSIERAHRIETSSQQR